MTTRYLEPSIYDSFWPLHLPTVQLVTWQELRFMVCPCHPAIHIYRLQSAAQHNPHLISQSRPLLSPSLLINKNFSSLLCFVLSYNCQPPRPQLAQLLTQSCLGSSQDPIIWRNYKPSIWTSFNFFQAWIVNVVSGSFQPSSSDWWLIFADCLLWEEKLHRIHIFRR